MKTVYVAIKENGKNITGYHPVYATFGYVIITQFFFAFLG